MIQRPVGFVEITPEDSRAQMISHGLPDVVADGIVGSMCRPSRGHGRTPQDTVEVVTGLVPRRFRHWALAHRDALTRPSANW